MVVAPMQEELEHLRHYFVARDFETSPVMIGLLPATEVPALGLLIARGGVGKAQFAVHTRHLLDHCNDIELVACAGAAGSLTGLVTVGDVVVATKTIEHDYGNRFTDRPNPEFWAAPMALASLRLLTAPVSFTIHYGPIASGDEDVVDVHRRQTLHKTTGALAVAWEGAGGARACALDGFPFVEIRGVTDNADSEAPDDFRRNLAAAMENVAAAITHMLSQHRNEETL